MQTLAEPVKVDHRSESVQLNIRLMRHAGESFAGLHSISPDFDKTLDIPMRPACIKDSMAVWDRSMQAESERSSRCADH